MQALEGSSALLGRSRNAFNSLNAIDPNFSEELLLFPQILVEIDELGHTLRRYEGKLDSNPATLDALHKRLTIIERFKRKYGDTLDKIQSYKTAQKERLSYLKNLENMLEEASEAYQKNLDHVKNLATQLTIERKKCAEDFSGKMSHHLHSLNMKDARFHIQLSPIPLSALGQDKVEFFLHTNVGEKLIALKDSASGGEIARVLLALHVLLAGKEKIGTLIFDEIDANIGGTTASLMGEGLKALGKSLQILSITHFPQVAKCAEHHLQIAKSAINGRTLSQVTYLSPDAREEELARMSGHSLQPI
jgi:DNA repair protein RecN (Recombination protein N)